jgi:hypothetical protein
VVGGAVRKAMSLNSGEDGPIVVGGVRVIMTSSSFLSSSSRVSDYSFLGSVIRGSSNQGAGGGRPMATASVAASTGQ